MGYELIDVETGADWVAYHSIRRQELFESRGRYGIYDEHYPGDHGPGMFHLLLKLDGEPIGTARLDIRDNGTAVFRLVAITHTQQHRGHGRVMGGMIEERARQSGTHTLFVNAAQEAHGFYRATGWDDYQWDRAELDGRASSCIQMRKHLT
jgi:N-acetylglutamate synthase-like GNAT family acetyltransferase